VKKLGPFSPEERSLGGGKWVGRKEPSLVCCNGKSGQLFSVQPMHGARSTGLQLQQVRFRSEGRSKRRFRRPWAAQFRKAVQAPSYEVTGNKPPLERVQVESCFCRMGLSYVPRI